MTNLEKIAALNEIWYSLLSGHYKDRDCHFYITQTFSYGQKGKWTVAHHGYVNHSYEETEWETYEECQQELINLLYESIKVEVQWYLDHYGDLDWDQHPKYDEKGRWNIISKIDSIVNDKCME